MKDLKKLFYVLLMFLSFMGLGGEADNLLVQIIWDIIFILIIILSAMRLGALKDEKK